MHDSRIQRGLHEYVDRNVHKVVGRLLTDTVPAIIWDRNKTTTSSAEWPAHFAHPMALRTPLPCTMYTNMLARSLYTLYSLTGPVKVSEDSVSDLSTQFSTYPAHRAHLCAHVIEVFRKIVPAEVLPNGKQPALGQSQKGHNSQVVVGMAPSLPSHPGL